jgi:hypothetical protein
VEPDETGQKMERSGSDGDYPTAVEQVQRGGLSEFRSGDDSVALAAAGQRHSRSMPGQCHLSCWIPMCLSTLAIPVNR